MDTTETYIKMCEKADEIQELRVNSEWPEFVHRNHKAGDYFACIDPNSIIIRMTGDDSPSEPVVVIYIFGSEQVQGTDIPKKEQYLDFSGKYKTFKDPLKQRLEAKIGLPLIWLPRQDQLQEMIKAIDRAPYKLHLLMARSPFETGEQLWLALLMYQNYNKVWNGEEWA